MNAERRKAQLQIAKQQRDLAAVAILGGGPRWQPEPPDHYIFSVKLWAGLRWTTGKAA